jgi:hypothetical protein
MSPTTWARKLNFHTARTLFFGSKQIQQNLTTAGRSERDHHHESSDASYNEQQTRRPLLWITNVAHLYFHSADSSSKTKMILERHVLHFKKKQASHSVFTCFGKSEQNHTT